MASWFMFSCGYFVCYMCCVFILPRASLLVLCFLCVLKYINFYFFCFEISCHYQCRWLPETTCVWNDLLCQVGCKALHTFSRTWSWNVDQFSCSITGLHLFAYAQLPVNLSLYTADWWSILCAAEVDRVSNGANLVADFDIGWPFIWGFFEHIKFTNLTLGTSVDC